jgi:hypothetical protein
VLPPRFSEGCSKFNGNVKCTDSHTPPLKNLSIQSYDLCDVTPYSLVGGYQTIWCHVPEHPSADLTDVGLLYLIHISFLIKTDIKNGNSKQATLNHNGHLLV